ncbi:MAG: SDR family NAD(P)-dependent oxidoreductase, partial [Candidatus Zixiibacteriota bacterium]
MRLKGKVALVTGGGQGIGRAIGMRLAREGASVAVADVDPDLAQSAIAEMQGLGVIAVAFKTDVSDNSQVEDLINKMTEKFSTIDILVNNAGITRDGLLIRANEEDWDRVMG